MGAPHLPSSKKGEDLNLGDVGRQGQPVFRQVSFLRAGRLKQESDVPSHAWEEFSSRCMLSKRSIIDFLECAGFKDKCNFPGRKFASMDGF